MKVDKKTRTEVFKVYDTWLHAYLNGDVATYDSYFEDDFHFIGSTNNEEFLNRKDTTQFFADTADQLAGKCDLRNETKIMEQCEGLVFITHLFDAWFKNGNDWAYYGRFRFTNALKENNEGWRFIYQHFSTTDSKTDEGETIGFDKVNAENQELREAIQRRTVELEEKNRELEIEAALERVRSRAMAMHKSDELLEAGALLYKELNQLGVKNLTTGYTLFDDKVKTGYSYGVNPADGTIRHQAVGMPHNETKIMKAIAKSWKKQEPLFVMELNEEETIKHQTYIAEHSTNFPLSAKQLLAISPKELKIHAFNFKQGYLLIVGDTLLTSEQQEMVTRFAKVFEMTYQRFLDLQKAEIQAREANIEAALERIRSNALAMKESSDLLDIVVTLRTEFIKLGHEAHYFWHMMWLPNKYEKAMTSGDGTRIGFVMELPRKIHAEIPLIAKWEKSKDPIAIYTMDVDAAIDYVDKMIGWGDFQNIDPRAPTHDDIKHIGGLTFIMARTTHGEIGYSLPGVVKNPPKEDLEILQRFAGAFDLAHRRFLDLKQAEAQAREAQIETALERVRAKSMGMQKSEDLWEVAELLFEQVKYLGIDTWSCGVSLWYDDDSYFMGYNPGPDGKIGAPMPIPLTEDIFFTTIRDAKRRGEDFLVFESAGKSLEETYRYMDTLPIVGEVMRGIVKAGFDLPEFQVTHCGFFSHGHLMFITLERKPEAIDIFKRFTKVFEQTYTRFLDLQKAEKQAREAQIEAALERTRTQSMLMQHSDQLDATSKVFHEQLQLLGIDTEFSYVWLPDEAKNEHQFWVAWNSEKKESSLIQSKAIVYPLDKTEPYTAACFEDWESGASVYIHHIEPKEVKTFFTAWEELLKDAKNLSPEYFLNGLYYAEAFMKYGCFGINIKRPITNEEKQILQRFSIEFERTYTRFLDLQKAEAQAREAQIEAALEKIRSRSLAMTKPDELQEVVSVVAEKLKELGVIYDAGGVILCTYFPDNKDVMHWIAAPDFTYSGNYLVPYFKNPIFDDAWESKLRGDAYFSKEFSVEDKNAFFKYAFEHSDYRHFPDEFKQHALQAVKHTLTAAWQKNSAIIIPSFSGDRPSESEADILKRFSKVFEQAYIRFLDLQKAEELTKKSKIEVALERVRARALAMQQPEELKEVAQVLRAEMGLLGIEELETSSIYINDKETNKTECWYAIKDLRSKKKKLVTDHFKLNLNDTWVGKQMLQFYDSKNEDTSIVMTGKNRVEWIRYCEEHSAPFRGHYGKIIPDRTYHLFKFSDGAIGVATPGDISEENWELLKRVAGVFSLAYSRFKDLTQARVDLLKLKDEKKKAEDALSELQLTQKQLIQSEKMASLGELTAGIAHEIQNPLNFVNNFSEVSQELIDELKEELENGNMDEVKEILNDVIQNLEKINHHGKRADGIVKGMLQHSRKSSAEKEPTNINKLADEYLRLAYHGLRAKDKSFNATLVTDFDESIGMVPVIPQDMGRVILNLITNAFYAVSERKKASEENHFEPTVSVSTKKDKDKVIISVQDNGNGVPTPVLDKIFQPFFTTKPTGEGTGLGLSMSYDIVTKGHSGELKVKTKENKGTEFKIIIPITKN